MAMAGSVLFKEFRLFPTEFWVDVWVTTNKDKVCQLFSDRYGESKEYYLKELRPEMVSDIDAASLNSETRIVVNLVSFDPGVVVHEAIHVFYHLQELVKLEVMAQEWIAYFVQYVVDNILDENTYIEMEDKSL